MIYLLADRKKLYFSTIIVCNYVRMDMTSFNLLSAVGGGQGIYI